MKTSQKGIDLIKKFEGCRLEAYQCPSGVWTIGFGHTGGVYPGMSITQQEAEDMIKEDLVKYERYADIGGLSQNQFDALVSFTYNVGPGNFMKSTLRKKVVKNKNDRSIALEFAKWKRGGGEVLPGLVKRREAESKLYFD